MTASALRPATPRDFSFVRSIAGRAENQAFIADVPEEELAGVLQDPDAAFLIWEQAGHPAGFAFFHQLQHPGNQTELRRLALDHTDKGLGRLFLEDLVRYAFETLDKARVWLDVAPNNTRAIRSYERAGFTPAPEGTNLWHRPDGQTVELLVFHRLRPASA